MAFIQRSLLKTFENENIPPKEFTLSSEESSKDFY